MPTFPIPGYRGNVEPHWGSAIGGSDVFAAIGSTVVSIVSGVVESAGNDGLGGNNVQIRGDDGLTYYYAHFRDLPLVRAGQRVAEGQTIGYVGTSGNAAGTSPHLHLGIGRGINAGGGPNGGVGRDFDAISYLRGLLAGAGAAAPGMPQPGQPAGPAVAPLPVPEGPGNPIEAVRSSIASLQEATGNLPDTLGAVANAVQAIPNTLITSVKGLAATLAWLGQVNVWQRLGLTAFGAVLVVVGLVLFALGLSGTDARTVAAAVA